MTNWTRVIKVSRQGKWDTANSGANESGQRIMGNEVFDGVCEVWDGVALQLEIVTETLRKEH